MGPIPPGKSVVAWLKDKVNNLSVFVNNDDPLPVRNTISSGTRSFRISLPIPNLEVNVNPPGFGAGLIRLDNIPGINTNNVNTNATDEATILEMLVILGGAGTTDFQILEISGSKEGQNPIWNETARIYRYNAATDTFNFVGDKEEGMLRWRSEGNEPNNQLNNDQLYIDFVNNTINVAQLNLLIGF